MQQQQSPFLIACTRFTDETYHANLVYRKKHKERVIYGSSLKIRNIYPPGMRMFVAEMNNDHDWVEGIGLITNNVVHDRHHRIYDHPEFNQYVYRGKHWLTRDDIMTYNPKILEILDKVLFKGKTHLKRRIGITAITPKLFRHWDMYDLEELKCMVMQLFRRYYRDRSESLNTQIPKFPDP